jgi:parvulin-like peptidyl-prolyl isomerase
MKCVYLSLLLSSALVFGQATAPGSAATPAAPGATPDASAAPEQVAPDAVVAKVGAKSVTAAELRKLLAGLPPEAHQAFAKNPKAALQSLYLIDFLKTEAEQKKLAETSPYKEQIEFQRSQMLAQAAAATHQAEMTVSNEDVEKRYEETKADYDTAKIRAIHLSFTDPKLVTANVSMADKTPKGALDKEAKPSEADAKAKADGLVKELRAGADFAKLAQENSDEKKSAAKGGEFGTVRRGDNLPPEIKNAIFALKAGEVSDPIHQPNGFYIIKVDERGTQPLSEVQSTIAQAMKQERYKQWLEGVQKQFDVTIENPSFFGMKTTADAPAPPAAPAAAARVPATTATGSK